MKPHPHPQPDPPGTGWRNACLAFAALSLVLAWRGCTRPRARPTAEACAALADDRAERTAMPGAPRELDDRARLDREAADRADDQAALEEKQAWSVTMPAWVMFLAPQPGEDLLRYRDRMVPLAQRAVAPHRARVARGRDDFAQVAGLNDHQRAELDAAVAEAADAIQDRVFESVLGGQLQPSTFKPMTGVALGRDLLDAVDRADRRFLASLRDDQRAALARHPFDLADYLLFSTRWEDMLGASE